MIQRRGFLSAILAAGFAPAAVSSGVLMPVRAIWTPYDNYGYSHDLMIDEIFRILKANPRALQAKVKQWDSEYSVKIERPKLNIARTNEFISKVVNEARMQVSAR
jgi:hypothetical protein